MRVKDCLFFFCMAGLLQKAAKEQDRDTACANCVPVLYGRRPIRQSSASLSRISRAAPYIPASLPRVARPMAALRLPITVNPS